MTQQQIEQQAYSDKCAQENEEMVSDFKGKLERIRKASTLCGTRVKVRLERKDPSGQKRGGPNLHSGTVKRVKLQPNLASPWCQKLQGLLNQNYEYKFSLGSQGK
mmetsp:Transcript_4955/g.8460  ORF Transcript_4955/g.8460 Transcript_4955/m.8460 type:complete len:105 (+) Transcript_4955:584-898(+)